MGGLNVKEGFAKYGAKAVFDKNRKLLFIYVSTWDKDVYPPEEGKNTLEQWSYAKWVSKTETYIYKLKVVFTHVLITHTV